MSAVRFPKIAELRQEPIIGWMIADILESLGIEDYDLPDIIADDFPYDDLESFTFAFPRLAAKLAGLDTPP